MSEATIARALRLLQDVTAARIATTRLHEEINGPLPDDPGERTRLVERGRRAAETLIRTELALDEYDRRDYSRAFTGRVIRVKRRSTWVRNGQ